MGLFITGHYTEQAGISILAHGRFPMGAVSILAYLTECSSEMSGFFYIRFQTQHKAIVPGHFREILAEQLCPSSQDMTRIDFMTSTESYRAP